MIRAPLKDQGAALELLERWERDVRPGASGFLGATGGVAGADELVLLARFEDQAAAERNSTRPEQSEWWSEFEATLAGPATFFESSQVDLSMGGGSDEAGFVQVMVGTGDREKALAVLGPAEEVLRKERPDILGGLTAWDGERFVDVAYFTSEAEARSGESKELSDEGRAAFEQFGQVLNVEEYLDISDPRLT